MPAGRTQSLPTYGLTVLSGAQRAAEAGHAGAQMNLSAYYFEGLGGLKKNLGTALAWARKAADQGEPGAAEKVTAITKLIQGGKQ